MVYCCCWTEVYVIRMERLPTIVGLTLGCGAFDLSLSGTWLVVGTARWLADVADAAELSDAAAFRLRAPNGLRFSCRVGVAESSALVYVSAALPTFRIEFCQKLRRHSRHIPSFTILVHATKAGTVANKHVRRGW